MQRLQPITNERTNMHLFTYLLFHFALIVMKSANEFVVSIESILRIVRLTSVVGAVSQLFGVEGNRL